MVSSSQEATCAIVSAAWTVFVHVGAQIFYITLLKIKRNVTCLVRGWLEAACVAMLETNRSDLAIRVLQLLG